MDRRTVGLHLVVEATGLAPGTEISLGGFPSGRIEVEHLRKRGGSRATPRRHRPRSGRCDPGGVTEAWVTVGVGAGWLGGSVVANWAWRFARLAAVVGAALYVAVGIVDRSPPPRGWASRW